jgi:CBS domain containing-hemolysin-like protein
MTAMEIAMWSLVFLLGAIGSATFSGLETGIYTLNRVRLHLRSGSGDRRAIILERMIAKPNRTLGTLLISNNIANYASSLGITALLEAAGFQDWEVIGFTALILTPFLFAVGEVVPKDTFQNHTDVLTYHFARFLRGVQILLMVTLLLPLIDTVSKALAWALGSDRTTLIGGHPRRVVTQLVRESVGHGVISAYQSDMIDRVLHPPERRVDEAMVPWADVHKLRASQPVEAVWAMANRHAHTRFPVTDRDGKALGVLDVFDVLTLDAAQSPPLESMIQPAPRLPARMNLSEALIELRKAQSPMGFVVGDNDRVLGLITTKDLVEPITGELDIW